KGAARTVDSALSSSRLLVALGLLSPTGIAPALVVCRSKSIELGQTRGDKLRANVLPDSTPDDQPRVLIVDDDQSLLAALSLALTRRGFRVGSAEGPGEAFEHIQREPGVDLIVLDVMMPGMDGVTALRLLRTSCTAPVLMLSAKDAVVDR